MFDVHENFVGPSVDVSIETGLYGGLDGGAFLEVGKEYLVFAYRSAITEPWYAGYCDRTAPIQDEQAAHDLRLLRERKDSHD